MSSIIPVDFLPDNIARIERKETVATTHLWASEQIQIVNAVNKRQREYSTVRWCARQALQQLGHPPVAIVNSADRDPCWPITIVGSMTHCAGYYAAALAHKADYMAIGMDAELHHPLPDGLVEVIAHGEELNALRRLMQTAAGIHWETLLFSIKESVFKAWFPLTRRWLDFHQVRVIIDVEKKSFSVKLTFGYCWPDTSELSGYWYVSDQLIVTAVTLKQRLFS